MLRGWLKVSLAKLGARHGSVHISLARVQLQCECMAHAAMLHAGHALHDNTLHEGTTAAGEQLNCHLQLHL